MNGCDIHGVSPPKCYIYTTCLWMDVTFMVFHHLNVIYIQPVYEWMWYSWCSPPKCYIYTICLWMDVIFMVFHHLNVIYIYNLSMNGCDLHGVSPPKCYIYTTCLWMDVIFMVFHHLNVIYIQPVYEWMWSSWCFTT